MVVGRQYFSRDRRRGLHDEAPDFAPELAEHARAVALGCLARPDEHLLGGGNGLPRLFSLDARRRGARFLDQCLAVLARPRQDGVALGLDPRQFGLDLLGVGEAVGDLLFAVPRGS